MMQFTVTCHQAVFSSPLTSDLIIVFISLYVTSEDDLMYTNENKCIASKHNIILFCFEINVEKYSFFFPHHH